jgi:hypothetical protein
MEGERRREGKEDGEEETRQEGRGKGERKRKSGTNLVLRNFDIYQNLR